MTQVGIVDRIHARGTFCFLKAPDGTEFFVNIKMFLNPQDMKVGKIVKFIPAPAPAPGKSPEATNVEAA